MAWGVVWLKQWKFLEMHLKESNHVSYETSKPGSDLCGELKIILRKESY